MEAPAPPVATAAARSTWLTPAIPLGPPRPTVVLTCRALLAPTLPGVVVPVVSTVWPAPAVLRV